jgi:hypothetical protein
MVWTHVRRRLIQRSQRFWAPTPDSRRPRSCLLQYCSNELPRNCHLVASTLSRISIHEQWITRWVSSLEHKLPNSWRELQCSAVLQCIWNETSDDLLLMESYVLYLSWQQADTQNRVHAGGQDAASKYLQLAPRGTSPRASKEVLKLNSNNRTSTASDVHSSVVWINTWVYTRSSERLQLGSDRSNNPHPDSLPVNDQG